MLKNILSYFYPTTKKIASDYNGTLEITTTNGKTVLDSKDANYSYGSLQKILEFGLSKIDFTNVNSVLVLGLGGGCVIKSLRDKFDYSNKITAVEIDGEIIKIASDFFGIEISENLEILCDDAFQYLQNISNLFDLIIIDLYINDTVPTIFKSVEFAKLLQQKIAVGGKVLFNFGLNIDEKSIENSFYNFFHNSEDFAIQKFSKVEGTNLLLIISKD